MHIRVTEWRLDSKQTQKVKNKEQNIYVIFPFLRNPIGTVRDLSAGKDKSSSLFLICTLTVIVSSLSPYTV